MGNIIGACIRLQVRAYGVGSLDVRLCKRCEECGIRQYTNRETCRYCGGTCRIISQQSATALQQRRPVVMAVDPETNRLAEFFMDGRGILHPVGRSEHHLWTPEQSRGNVRNTHTTPQAETEDDDEQAIDLPLVNAIEGDAILEIVCRLADLVDPDRAVVPEIPLNKNVVLTEHMDTATSSTDDSSSTSDRINRIKEALHNALEVVQCPVCLSEFSSPTTLPCGHSLCRIHISELEKKCPICREAFAKGLYRESDRINETLVGYVEAVNKLAALAEKELVVRNTSVK